MFHPVNFKNDPINYSGSQNVGKAYACKRGQKRLGSGTCAEKADRFESLARNRLPYMSEEYQGLSDERWDELMVELKEEFIRCCKGEAESVGRVDGIDLSDPQFIVTEASEVLIRNDFRESWAFDIVDIPEE